MLPEHYEPITVPDPWLGAPFSKPGSGVGREGAMAECGVRGEDAALFPGGLNPTAPKVLSRSGPLLPALSAAGLARPCPAITSSAQQRPTGGPRALPLIWEPNCLWVGGGGPRPCDDTRVPLPRAGAPSPSPGAAHPLGWLMQ